MDTHTQKITHTHVLSYDFKPLISDSKKKRTSRRQKAATCCTYLNSGTAMSEHKLTDGQIQ